MELRTPREMNRVRFKVEILDQWVGFAADYCQTAEPEPELSGIGDEYYLIEGGELCICCDMDGHLLKMPVHESVWEWNPNPGDVTISVPVF